MAKKNKGGRPPKSTPMTLKKLEEAFAIDATIEEACFYADISPQTYYEWVKKNPKLNERFKALRNTPVLLARRTVVGALKQPSVAFEYLKRKKRKEFGDSIDHTTDGEKFEITGIVINTPKDAKKTTDSPKS